MVTSAISMAYLGSYPGRSHHGCKWCWNLKELTKKVPFFRDALYLKDVHEAERSQIPEHVFHEDIGKLKAVKGENPWRVVFLELLKCNQSFSGRFVLASAF